ncbi:hypothetical protein DFH06DRAFT_1161 [Mycena polygramma]|nr:hypothetical protein DFH06DRAFT_1161 [Mycena polygramma]
MVLTVTSRAYKEISRWLPNEVVAEIIQHAPKDDQAALCRVSKLFQGLCVPALYRVVCLEKYASAMSFYSSLLANPQRGAAVRSFTISYIDIVWDPGPRSRPPPEGLIDPLLNSMRLMLQLEHLTIRDGTLDNSQWFSLLEQTFPQLLSLGIGAPLNNIPAEAADKVPSFLARHPGLRRLHIFAAPSVVAPSVQICLPNLQGYNGPPNLVPWLVGCKLREAQLQWWERGTDADIDRVIGALGPLTNSDIPFHLLHEFPRNCYGTIMAAVSTHVPHTKTLRLRCWMDDLALDSVAIDHITAQLPRLTSLVYLAIESSDQTDVSRFEENQARATLETWAHACPTLEGCWFNTVRYAWKKVDNAWLKCSVDEFRALDGSSYWSRI